MYQRRQLHFVIYSQGVEESRRRKQQERHKRTERDRRGDQGDPICENNAGLSDALLRQAGFKDVGKNRPSKAQVLRAIVYF